ncbi:endoglucanase A [Patella vulgata]|uniref:endoglucanase A n=1 Tax=Patella vulgata TaxID=6465 RepID=UPI0024A8FCF2|nr:endoglucanase A [Patella vulgata]XP_050412038.2 endoglucanase A [Patella vulgata]
MAEQSVSKFVVLPLLILYMFMPIHDSIFLIRPFLKGPLTIEVPKHNFWPFIPVVPPIQDNKTYYSIPRHNFWPFIPIVAPFDPDVSITTPSIPTSTIAWTDNDGGYDYSEVLGKSLLFYEAQRSGRLPLARNVAWRGDSATNDQGIFGEDLSGGWYDAGDYVKFGLPMAGATTLLVWGLIEFKSGYEAAGLLANIYDSVLWPLAYFMKAHPTKFEFYAQVADPYVDHSYWGRPEDMKMYRPGYRLSPERPGSDVIGETAAALAAGAVAFKSRDAPLALQMLKHAEELFEFAETYQGKYSDVLTNVQEFYASSGYEDELCWAAAWLYRATGLKKYLKAAERYYRRGSSWALSWDEKRAASMVLLYTLTKQDKYREDIESTIKDWMPGGSVQYTPKGLAYRLRWGSLRYTANMAMIALMSANAGINPTRYRVWARKQIHYMLGDGGRSYVVGFGVNPPTRPHHASSSCSSPPWPCTWADFYKNGPNTHTLYGALVGGPDEFDNFIDDRADYVQNEVTCDYNAGFQSAIAGLKELQVRHRNHL